MALHLSLTAPLGETVRMAEPGSAFALDESTFGPITESLRRDLLLHCFRFTGSVQEAEDLVQETLARAWRGRAGYRADAGPRTWLRRIATRVCLDALRQARGRRRLPTAPMGVVMPSAATGGEAFRKGRKRRAAIRCQRMPLHRTGRDRLAAASSAETSARAKSRSRATRFSSAWPLSHGSVGLMRPFLVKDVMIWCRKRGGSTRF